MSNENFDLKIRSMLENGVEEVPSGLWSAIEDKIPTAPAGRKAISLWKILSTASAVAAAAVIALLITDRQKDKLINISETGQSEIAEVILPAKTAEEDIFITEISNAKVVYNSENNKLAHNITDVQSISDEAEAQSYEAELHEEDNAIITEDKKTEEQTQSFEKEQTPAKEESPVAKSTEHTDKGNKTARAKKADRVKSADTYPASRIKIHSVDIYTDAVGNTSGNKDAASNGIMKRPAASLVKKGIEETGASSYSLPLSLGLGVRFQITDRWSVGTGVNWTYMSRKFPGQYNEMDENGKILSQTSYASIQNNQNYIGIPLNLYFSIINTDFIDFYTYASGSVNKCLSNNYILNGEGGNICHVQKHNGWQYSAGLGLGVEFIVSKHFGIYIDPSFSYWFSDGKVQNIRTDQALTMGLELGMRFKF